MHFSDHNIPAAPRPPRPPPHSTSSHPHSSPHCWVRSPPPRPNPWRRAAPHAHRASHHALHHRALHPVARYPCMPRSPCTRHLLLLLELALPSILERPRLARAAAPPEQQRRHRPAGLGRQRRRGRLWRRRDAAVEFGEGSPQFIRSRKVRSGQRASDARQSTLAPYDRRVGRADEARSDRREEAISQIVWALLTSSELRFNH